MSYPPPPWRLRGRAWLSIWLSPGESSATTPSLRALRLGGRAPIIGMWAQYSSRSTLAYSELLIGALILTRWGPALNLACAWVDSESSLQAGRKVWGIPKRLGRFDDMRLSDDRGSSVAAMDVQEARRLPGRWPLLGSLVQTLGPRLIKAGVRGSAAVMLVSARWRAPERSPLAAVVTRPPLVSLQLDDMQIQVGAPTIAQLPQAQPVRA